MGEGRTVEGFEGLHYITNGDGEAFEDLMNAMMYEYSDEVVYAALDLRGQWIMDSNNSYSLAMEKEVAKLLNVEHRHYSSELNMNIENLNSSEKSAVHAIYDVTQRLLHAKKIEYIIVYRGFSWSERPDWVNKELKVGDTIQIIEQRTLSSWSILESVAKGFANKNYGFVVRAVMPVDRIFAIIDIIAEAESVCISNDGIEKFEVVFIEGGE